MKNEQLYFISQNTIDLAMCYDLDEETSHHLSKVLRHKVGETLHLTNGKGIKALASIERIDKKTCLVKINEICQSLSQPDNLCLAVSPLKNPQRWEWMMEKAVELGVSEIIPLLCRHTEKKNVGKDERTLRIIKSAMLQSQSLWMPIYGAMTPLEDFLEARKFKHRYIAHCDEQYSRKRLPMSPPSSSTCILIGPEGDFDSAEIQLAVANGYTAISLGSRRLRTETAALHALSILQYASYSID